MVLVALTAAACTTSTGNTVSTTTTTITGSSTATLHGTVRGRILASGGPAPGTPRPISGTAVLVNVTSGARFTAKVGKSGRYMLTLPPGTYRLTCHSPFMNGGQMVGGYGVSVRVVAGEAVGKNCVFQLK